MSDQAIFNTTQALRDRIHAATDNDVYVGPPVTSAVKGAPVSLFLFQLQVNGAMRNEPFYAPYAAPPPGQSAAPAQRRDALPLDLRYLITVFRTGGPDAPSPTELTTLGQIIAALHAQPTLPGNGPGGQAVRLTPEPASTEEIHRIWGLFPQDFYRTSVVYLATPVIVEARAFPAGPPVQLRSQSADFLPDNANGVPG